MRPTNPSGTTDQGSYAKTTVGAGATSRENARRRSQRTNESVTDELGFDGTERRIGDDEGCPFTILGFGQPANGRHEDSYQFVAVLEFGEFPVDHVRSYLVRNIDFLDESGLNAGFLGRCPSARSELARLLSLRAGSTLRRHPDLPISR